MVLVFLTFCLHPHCNCNHNPTMRRAILVVLFLVARSKVPPRPRPRPPPANAPRSPLHHCPRSTEDPPTLSSYGCFRDRTLPPSPTLYPTTRPPHGHLSSLLPAPIASNGACASVPGDSVKLWRQQGRERRRNIPLLNFSTYFLLLPRPPLPRTPPPPERSAV